MKTDISQVTVGRPIHRRTCSPDCKDLHTHPNPEEAGLESVRRTAAQTQNGHEQIKIRKDPSICTLKGP